MRCNCCISAAIGSRRLSAATAKKSHPELRVLITSAHIDQLAHVSKGDGFQVLNKPYREGDLAVAIRKVLDGVYVAG